MKKNLYLRYAFAKPTIRTLFITLGIALAVAALASVATESTLLYADQVSLNNNGTDKNRPEINSTDWPTILILGDSLSAAFGMDQSQGWVSLLKLKLAKDKHQLRVINASISGETTQGGLHRLPKLLEKHEPAIVIIELGGNDGLRGLDLAMIKTNLLKIISHINKVNATPLLIGIRLPPNYGQIYTKRFHQIYLNLAKEEEIALLPFLLEGIATNESLMQSDGIHPTATAQAKILENVWQSLLPIIQNYKTIAEQTH